MALNGLTLNFSDLSASEKGSLSKLITKNGGTVSYIFGKNVTHLVTTNQAIQENGYKIQRCKKDNIKPVTEKWLRKKISDYKQVEAQENYKKEKEIATNKEKKDTKQANQLALQFSPPYEELPLPTVSMVLPATAVYSGEFKVRINHFYIIVINLIVLINSSHCSEFNLIQVVYFVSDLLMNQQHKLFFVLMLNFILLHL